MASLTTGVHQLVLGLLPWQTLTAFWPQLLPVASTIEDIMHSDPIWTSLSTRVHWQLLHMDQWDRIYL